MAYLALIGVQICFGLWPTFGKLAMTEIAPPAIVGFRCVLAAPLLLWMAWKLERKPIPPRRELFALAGLGFVGVSLNQLLFIEGLRLAGPINAVILVIVIPVMSLAAAMLLRLEQFSWRRTVCIAVAVAGVRVLVRVESFDVSGRTTTGYLLLVGNATAYAVYLVWAKPVFARVGGVTSVAWVFVFGALFALPVSACTRGKRST